MGICESTFRYIGDMTPNNDNGNFNCFKNEIYPVELKLNKKNIGMQNANVLNIDVKLQNGSFLLGELDKTKFFNFDVIK